MTLNQSTLSSNNVKVILDDLEKCPPDLVLEFGAGGSTLFFLECIKKNCRYKAFENTKQWFSKLVESMEEKHGTGQSEGTIGGPATTKTSWLAQLSRIHLSSTASLDTRTGRKQSSCTGSG